jgi:hypothetical protein
MISGLSNERSPAVANVGDEAGGDVDLGRGEADASAAYMVSSDR